MKLVIALALTTLAQGALAAPCFHAGTYTGKGFATDAAGKEYAYDVTTTIADSAQGTSSYTWTGGAVSFSFKADAGKLLVDGKEAGTVECGMATQRLNMVLPDVELHEEWS